MPPWLTPANYALRRACDERTVQRAVKRGEIPTSRSGKIDAAVVDAMWEPKVTRPKSKESQEAAPTAPVASMQAAAPANAFQRASQAEKIYKARKARLEYQREAGKVVSLDEARKVLGDFARRVGELLDALPSSMTEAIEQGLRCRSCGQAVEVRDALLVMEDHLRTLREHLAGTEA